MKQNGTQQRRVTDLGGNATFPDVHPDGRTVVFAGREAGQPTPDIWTVGLDGTGLTRLTTSPGVDQFPVFSPDGQQIAFRSNWTGTHQIWVMDADGTDQRPLTADPAPKDQLPEWSPDGSRIAYAAASPGTGLDLWVMDADGSDQRQVLADSDDTIGPAWSPDGSHLAFLNVTDDVIQTMPWCGGGVRTIHADGSPYVPSWQPRPGGGR